MATATTAAERAAQTGPAPFFQMGEHTPRVDMLMHQENRLRVAAKLRELNADLSHDAYVVVHAGEEAFHNDTDHELLFRPESNYNYLFGSYEPGFYGAIHVGSGQSILFVPRLAEEYAVWMGTLHPPAHFQAKYAVDHAAYVDEIASTLEARGARCVLVLHGYNWDGKRHTRPATFAGIERFEVNTAALYPALSECRVFKTPRELQLMRQINDISSEAHKAVMRAARPGTYEWQMESCFLHEIYSRGGCRFVSYICICGSGHNGAVLHYGHSGAPNARRIEDGDMLLFDMGALYHGYASDITCSFPANGKFTPDQRAVYMAVLEANLAVQRAMRPGVAWVDMHLLSERVILAHLVKMGVLQGDVEDMMKVALGAVFMPHGLGHFMGCDTHDVGGYSCAEERPQRAGLRSLRTTRVLQPNMVITVEPGLYFIDALLDRALASPEQSVFIVEPVLRRFRGFGGVRIEDDVIVTETGVELMTKVPRHPDEIEAWMAGAADRAQ